MWIEKIQIKNFGKFYDKTIGFSEGLNVIYGGNESGKTTIHNFLTGMLFGIEKSRRRSGKEDIYGAYEPWNSASYYVGNMIMQIDGKRFLLERNFYHKEKTAKLRNLLDQEELSVEFGDLNMLLGGITRENYQNTYCIRQAGFLADESLAGALENYMADVSNSGDGSVRIQAAQEELLKRKKAVEKEKKRLEAIRTEKVERLTMEAELLKKDIAFQKNSELAETIARQEEQAEEREEQPKAKPLSLQWGLLLGIVFFSVGILCFSGGKTGIKPGLICILISGISFLIAGSRAVKRHSKEPEVPSPEIAEGLTQIKEQWTEKENRCYNIEEQLLELSEPSQEELELDEDRKALELAVAAMKKIAGQIYDDVSDELHEAVSRNLSRITDGKYDSIILDEELHLFIWENGKKIAVNQLSRGTLEQAYLAMRMAVGSILMKEEPMPVLLDETFSMYDDARLADTLRWLAEYPGQILLFSCQKREFEILERLSIPYHKIVLD